VDAGPPCYADNDKDGVADLKDRCPNVATRVANRLGMRFTKNIAVGFPYQPQVSPLLKDARVVGVPLRSAIATLDRAASRAGAREHFGLDPHRPTLFVFGASQGARSINLAVSGAAKEITAAGIQVLHVTGARNEAWRSATCRRGT
jgi:UDP-N-acetylglucosamine--N-acetylmuramyl-(pentapeptide) pyrophosphoryl-undecaprenol N-acetylglucosamine transferase